MHINVSKIDERIQKLQEVKRIASDPELLRMIAEFMATEERAAEPAPAARAAAAAASATRVSDEDLVNNLMKDMDNAGGGGIWSRARTGKGA
jgi:hypothetical protein